jgi:hypothetical protein
MISYLILMAKAPWFQAVSSLATDQLVLDECGA